MTGAGRPLVLCFHHAGAGTSCFDRWPQVLGAAAEVVPVLLPGRQHRARERRLTDPDELVAVLAAELRPRLDRPYVVYGHSLGGLVGRHVVAEAVRWGLPAPELLVLGAVTPPHLPTPLTGEDVSDDGALLRALHAYGLLPAEATDDPGHGVWRRWVLPVVRDDLLLAQALRRADTGPTTVPVLAVAGTADRMAPPAHVAQWDRYAAGRFDLRAVPGGHLFHRERRLPELLRDALRADGRQPCRSGTDSDEEGRHDEHQLRSARFAGDLAPSR